MAEKRPEDIHSGAGGNEETDDVGDTLSESLGSQSSGSGLASSSDSYSMPKRQRETSPSRSPGRSESPSAPYRMVPRECHFSINNPNYSDNRGFVYPVKTE